MMEFMGLLKKLKNKKVLMIFNEAARIRTSVASSPSWSDMPSYTTASFLSRVKPKRLNTYLSEINLNIFDKNMR